MVGKVFECRQLFGGRFVNYYMSLHGYIFTAEVLQGSKQMKHFQIAPHYLILGF